MADEKEYYASTLLKRIHESEFPCEKVSLTSGKDNQKFPIHIVVLTAASKYFAASLGPNFKDGKKDEFILEGTDGGTVKRIVDYCYTGEIYLTEENVGRYLTIASSVQLDLLEAKCRQYYEDKLSVSNCVDVLMVAEKYSYVAMRQKALDVICGSFDQVSAAEIQKLDHRSIQELLKCDKIQAKEELVFTRLLEWFQYDEMDRRSHMPELLKLIRLDLIAAKFLNDTIAVAYENFNCFNLVVAEYKQRALKGCSNNDGRRFGLNWCLFTQFKGVIIGAQQSAIKIEKFITRLNSFEDAGEISLGNRIWFGLVMLKNQLFVLGGNNGATLKSVSAFDLNTGTEEIMPEMNSAREHFASISRGKYIYVFGGNGNSTSLKSCERFDTETKTWTIIKEMNFARSHHRVTLLNNYICVAGGYFNSQHLNCVELYDPTKDEWTQLASMHHPRSAFTIIKSNESLYAMGYTADIERYDHRQNCWTNVGSFRNSEHITSAIDIGGNIFAIMKNGEFGRITIEENGAISFVRLGKSKYESKYRGRHILCQN